jgi:hypothetical protein
MKHCATELRLACRYQAVWQDGFGARGWKLDSTLADPNIIASTPEAGDVIPTAVFIHDILDHALCGLPPSGHRAEAVALIQLAERTGADPRPDFEQMVDEDLMNGVTDGEPLMSLLPDDLKRQVGGETKTAKAAIGELLEHFGRDGLRERLVRHLFWLGHVGAKKARAAYEESGLAYPRRAELGLALQRLFMQADGMVRERDLEMARGWVGIARQCCSISLDVPERWRMVSGY